jgi:predicted nuclease with TOPRIM domain
MKHWKPFTPGGKYTCNECPRSIDNYPEILSLQMRIHELEHELELARLPKLSDIKQSIMRFPPGTLDANKFMSSTDSEEANDE